MENISEVILVLICSIPTPTKDTYITYFMICGDSLIVYF